MHVLRRSRRPVTAARGGASRAFRTVTAPGHPANAEEKLLSRTFGERYALYRQRTKMIIPYVL
jgi:hypothetical protein